MKKYRLLWIILFIAAIVGAGYGVLSYSGGDRGKKEMPYLGETTMIERYSFEEFVSEVVNLVKEYDCEKIDEEEALIPYYSRRLIVQGMGEKLDLSIYGAKIVLHGPDDMYIMQFTTKEAAEAACIKLQEVENIEYCEPDRYAEGFEGNGNYEAMSWGVREIGADVYAKNIKELEKESITVAVIDTGVYQHPFLKDRIVNGGMDLVDNDMR